ncbi:MAG: hypothetical protein ACT4PO_02500 [Actinomycetota bacterium]
MKAPTVRPLTVGMRRLLYVASGLVALAAFQLFVLTDQTGEYFSWTIEPRLTAAFLGAGYLASVFFEGLGARARDLADARITVPAVLTFTVLTEIATLLHLDKFHFGEPFIWAGAAAWVWILIYTCVPIALIVLLIGQLRTPGVDPPRTAPIPSVAVWVLRVQSAILLIFGAVLFLAPERAGAFWPWALTPLTGQAVGAWLLGVGVGAMHASIEADLVRIRPGLVAFAILGAFELIALARYSADVDWSKPSAWYYLAFLVSILAAGVLGLLALARVRGTSSP